MIFDGCRPKVSLIIPIYQVEDYLSMCLDSCLEQTLLDMEIICVDDGSKDDSGNIADAYAKLDPRIKVIHKENGGLSSARNAGLKAAQGELIMFLDSDDYLQPWACARMWEENLQHPADIIIFGSDVFPAYYKVDDWLWWTLSTPKAYFTKFKPFVLFKTTGAIPFVWRQAYTRKLLEKADVMFDESVRYGEDVIFQLEVFPYAKYFSFIPDRAYMYRFQRPDSLMAVEKKDEDGRIRKHITVVEKGSAFWYERGLMDKYGKYYFEWALEYIVSDLKKYNFKDVGSVARDFMTALERMDLLKYESELDWDSNGKTRLKQLKALTTKKPGSQRIKKVSKEDAEWLED